MQTFQPVQQKRMTANELFFHILLAVVWTQHTIWPYLIQVYRRVPIIGSTYNYILPMLIAVATLMALPYIIKKVKATDLLFIIGSVLLVIFSYLFYIENQPYIVEKLGQIFLYVIPMYFLGICCRYNECKKTLFWVSLSSVVVKFAYQIYLFRSGDLLGAYDMDAAYKVLPSVMFLVLWALENQGLRNWLLAALGIFLELTYGTRGPVLAVLIFLAIGIYIRVLHSHKRYVRVIFIVSAAVILLLFSSPSITMFVFERLSKFFESFGFSTRIFDFILEGELAESSGRDVLLEGTINAVKERLFLGYGIMGDRVILGGIYCHNIFWEFLCDFGIVFGSLFLIAIVVLFVRAILHSAKNENLFFVLTYISMIVIKLMLSNSYIIEPYFFFTIGICVAAIRVKSEPKEN